MRATCPSCEAVYEIPDRLVGAGRRLRCANCGNEWTVLPPAAAGALAAPTPETPAAAAAGPVVFKETPAPAPHSYGPAPRGAAPPAHTVLRRPPQLIEPPLPPVEDFATEPRGAAALRAAWIGSVLLVALALGFLWTFRYEIAVAWPPAARLTGTPVGGG